MIKFQLLSEYLQQTRLSTKEKIDELMELIEHRNVKITPILSETIFNACDDELKDILDKKIETYMRSYSKKTTHIKKKQKTKSEVKPIYILDNSKRWV